MDIGCSSIDSHSELAVVDELEKHLLKEVGYRLGEVIRSPKKSQVGLKTVI